MFSMLRSGSVLIGRRGGLRRAFGGDGQWHRLSTMTLKEAVAAKIPAMQEEVREIREKHGNKTLGTCTVAQAYGGMRSVKCMTYETSLLDPIEGIRFRGLTIPDCQVRSCDKIEEDIIGIFAFACTAIFFSPVDTFRKKAGD